MSLGRIAYEAYAATFPGKGGELAFPWPALPTYVQECWEASAAAVATKTVEFIMTKGGEDPNG